MWGDLSSVAHGSHQLEVRSKLPLLDKADAVQVLPPTHSPHLPPHRHLGVFAFVTQALTVAPSEAYPLAPGGCGISLEPASGLTSPMISLVTSLCLSFLICCVVLGPTSICKVTIRHFGRRGRKRIYIWLLCPGPGSEVSGLTRQSASFPSDWHFPAPGTGASLRQTAVASRDVTLRFHEL